MIKPVVMDLRYAGAALKCQTWRTRLRYSSAATQHGGSKSLRIFAVAQQPHLRRRDCPARSPARTAGWLQDRCGHEVSRDQQSGLTWHGDAGTGLA
jgi:hypothetical protein